MSQSLTYPHVCQAMHHDTIRATPQTAPALQHHPLCKRHMLRSCHLAQLKRLRAESAGRIKPLGWWIETNSLEQIIVNG